MLPTNEISNIGKPVGKLEYDKHGFDPHVVNTFELYFISDEEIKEGDYCIDGLGELFGPYIEGDTININNIKAKKIIATTDKSLSINLNNPLKARQPGKQIGSVISGIKSLPQPSQAFVKGYCEQGGIDEVMVEYINRTYAEWIEGDMDPKYYSKLIIDSHNIITIHPVKDSWNKEEVLKIIKDSHAEAYCENGLLKGKSPVELLKWINKIFY